MRYSQRATPAIVRVWLFLGLSTYYTMSHGSDTFFDSSPLEQALRALLHRGTLVGCVVFLIVSGKNFTLQEERRKN